MFACEPGLSYHLRTSFATKLHTQTLIFIYRIVAEFEL